MIRFILGAIILAGPGFVPGAAAQALPVERALGQVGAGQRLKVEVAGSVWVGRYQRFEGGELFLARDSIVERLALERISGLWVRGRATKTGAIIGAIAGVGFGAFLGMIVASVCEYDCPDRPAAMAVGGLLGGASGVGMGAIIGAAIPRWKRVFR